MVFLAVLGVLIAWRVWEAYGMTAVLITLAIVTGIIFVLRRNESFMAILLILLGLVGILGSLLFRHFAAH